MEYFIIIISSIFINNIVLSQILGICPFFGVSSKVNTAAGMGAAVTFVMAINSIVVYFLQKLLVAWNIEFMQTIVFILVIATLVQMVEIILKKLSPSLYQALGVFLPLITTNCAVLGLTILNIDNEYSFLQSVVNAFFSGLGFMMVLLIFSGVRSKVEEADIPETFKGIPSTLIAAAILSLSFLGFSGLGN